MAKKGGANYILVELEWLEAKIKEFRDLIDSYSPFSSIEDRTEVVPDAKGIPVIKVIAKKEETIKVIKDIMKDIPIMLRDLGELRAEQAEKLEIRGGGGVNGMMSNKIEESS